MCELGRGRAQFRTAITKVARTLQAAQIDLRSCAVCVCLCLCAESAQLCAADATKQTGKANVICAICWTESWRCKWRAGDTFLHVVTFARSALCVSLARARRPSCMGRTSAGARDTHTHTHADGRRRDASSRGTATCRDAPRLRATLELLQARADHHRHLLWRPGCDVDPHRPNAPARPSSGQPPVDWLDCRRELARRRVAQADPLRAHLWQVESCRVVIPPLALPPRQSAGHWRWQF